MSLSMLCRTCQVRANVVSFNAALSAFEVGAEWQKALLLLHQMPNVRMAMDARSQSGRIS